MLFIPYLKSTGRIKGNYMITPTPQDLSVFGEDWEDYAIIFDYVNIRILDKNGKEDSVQEQKIYVRMEDYKIDIKTKKLVLITGDVDLDNIIQEEYKEEIEPTTPVTPTTEENNTGDNTITTTDEEV